jgi:hypothetical protein
MARTEGKRLVLLTALALDIFALIVLVIAFITPYWVISWARVYSPFRRMGLWEACFYGLIIDRDPTQKAYHGCWWILAPELQNIRDWIMPPWFIVVQILMSFSVFIEILVVIFDLMLWISTSRNESSGLGKRRARYDLVQAATYIAIITSSMKTIAVIMFGLGFNYDPFWLPKREINYPHISYGLAILSAFFSIFASMAHMVHRRIVREDDYKYPAGQGGPTGTARLAPPSSYKT